MSDPRIPTARAETPRTATSPQHTVRNPHTALQASYGTQPAYSQAPAGQQPAYGWGLTAYNAGAAYGQPMCRPGPCTRQNPAIERVRSNASMVRIMSLVSFVTLGPLVSFGAWFWSMSSLVRLESLGAPEDVLRDVRGARTTALLSAELLGSCCSPDRRPPLLPLLALGIIK